VPIPDGFPNGNDLMQFLVQEGMLSAPSPDCGRYDQVMEAVAGTFLKDIKRQNFIVGASESRFFTHYGGGLLIPPFGISTLTGVNVDGETRDVSTMKLSGRTNHGIYTMVRVDSCLPECEVEFVGTFGMVPSMPVHVKRALLGRGAADIYDGVEGTSSYVGSGDIKKITQGPVTVEYDVGIRSSQSAREVNPYKQTYASVVREFVLRKVF
jgi:hypothetical protein